MTFKEYFDTLATSAPFVLGALLAIGTAYGKVFKLEGSKQFIACFATGFIVGWIYYFALLGLPADFQTWMYALLTALVMGVLPTGLYEAIKEAGKSG